MMVGAVLGQRTTKMAAVSTSAIILEAATKQKTVILESVTICNTNAASRTVSLYVDTGSAQFYVFNDLALASKATVELENHSVVLAAGSSLKAIASGAGINVVATLMLANPNMANDGGVTTLSSVASK